MKLSSVTLFISCFIVQFGFCQLTESTGPNSTAMAGLNANNIDVWAINYNVGQLENIEANTIGISFYQPFLLNDFSMALSSLSNPVSTISEDILPPHTSKIK